MWILRVRRETYIRKTPLYAGLVGRVSPGARNVRLNGGGSRIRTYVLIRGQIYSLLPLTARPSHHILKITLPEEKGFCVLCQVCNASSYEKT